MKKIIAVVVVLALLLGVAPWGIGQLAEKRVNAGLDQLVQQAPYLSIVERKWTRGWFRSEQEVTFELFGPMLKAVQAAIAAEKLKTSEQSAEAAQPESDAPPDPAAKLPAAPAASAGSDSPAPPAGQANFPISLRFTVRNEVLHGPVLWPASLGVARINTKFELNEEIRKALMDSFGTDDPLQVSTRVGFFGGATTRLSGDGRTIKVKNDQGSFSYDAFKLDLDYSGKFDKVGMDGDWPRFEFSNPKTGESVLVKDMELKGSGKRVLGDLYDSDFKFTVDKMSLVGTDKSVTEIDGVHYVVESDFKDDFASISTRTGSGKVQNKALSDLKLDLDEINYDMTFRRLHTPTLAKLMTDMKLMYQKPLVTAADIDTAIMEPLKRDGFALLKYDPELSIDRLGIVTPEGEGVIKGVIRLKGATEADFSSEARMGLVAKIEADLTVEVAQKLIEKIPNGNTGAGAAIDQGFARREGDKLVSHIEFKQGSLKINGKPVPIPGLGPPTAQPTSQE